MIEQLSEAYEANLEQIAAELPPELSEEQIELAMIGMRNPEIIDLGHIVMQFNPIRALRPKRAASLIDVPLNMPLKHGDYNFASCSFDKEIVHSETVKDVNFDFAPNRYPFAQNHTLVVPQRQELHNQYLDPVNDTHIITAVMQLAANNPDLRFGYNSMGAHASVNHLHFHGFSAEAMPIDAALEKAPEYMKKFMSKLDFFVDAYWIPFNEGFENLLQCQLKSLEKSDARYNLYIGPKGVVLFPRKSQGDKYYSKLLSRASFTTGLGFYELCGVMVCTDAESFAGYKQSKDMHEINRLYNTISLNFKADEKTN